MNHKAGKIKIRAGLYLFVGERRVVEIRKTHNPVEGMKWATFDRDTGQLLMKHKTLKDAIEVAEIELKDRG